MNNSRSILCAIVSGLVLSACADEVTLRASEELPVFANVDSAMIGDERNAISHIAKDRTVFVTDCFDLKSSFVMKVKLDDEKNGYVMDGKFDLNRTPACHDP